MSKKLLFLALILTASAFGQYPASLATVGELLCASNQASTTITAAMDATQTTMTVASTAAFSTCSTGFLLVVEAELIRCATRNGPTSFTACTRGFDNTTAAPHPSGAPARGLYAAAHHNRLVTEIIAIQQALGVNFGNATGLLTKTASGFLSRVITSTDPTMIQVANGDGQSGNIQISPGADVAKKSDSSGVPSGMVMFSRNASCPNGWSVYANAQGRYIVGVQSGGTLEAVVGQALTNAEERAAGQHTHAVQDAGHSHGLPSTVGFSGSGVTTTANNSTPGSVVSASATTGITLSPAGVSTTPAPYIQLTPCVKN